MARPEKQPTPVDVVGELSLSSPDGVVFEIRGQGSSIDFVAGRLRDLLAIRKDLPARLVTPVLPKAQTMSRHGGVVLRIMVRRNEVGRLSPDSKGNWVGRLFGLAPAEIRVGGVIRALVT